MKKIILLLLAASSLQLSAFSQSAKSLNEALHKFFDQVDEEALKLDPVSATFRGDNRYNSLLTIDFTESNRGKQKTFYETNLAGIKKFKRDQLNDNDRISYDV